MIRIAASLAVAAALAAPLPAQLIGPNPGVIFVSPLGEPQPSSTPTSSTQRKAARAAAALLAQLEPVRRRADRAARYAADAAATRLELVRIARLERAVRYARSAKRRVDALRARHATDEAFLREADDLAFSVRKRLARYKRALEAAEK